MFRLIVSEVMFRFFVFVIMVGVLNIFFILFFFIEFCSVFFFVLMFFFCFFFFFFQAEDGIRDRTVTGVQTCALPISILDVPCTDGGYHLGAIWFAARAAGASVDLSELLTGALREASSFEVGQIGRASCRGRGWVAGGGGAV